MKSQRPLENYKMLKIIYTYIYFDFSVVIESKHTLSNYFQNNLGTRNS